MFQSRSAELLYLVSDNQVLKYGSGKKFGELRAKGLKLSNSISPLYMYKECIIIS